MHAHPCTDSFLNTLRAILSVMLLATVCSTLTQAQVSVLTQKNDNSRTGQNLNETYLTTGVVNANHFGSLFTQSIDGYAVAEPLYAPNLVINGATHNVIFVVTLHDGVYAFDADSNAAGNASPLWYQSLIDPPNVTTVPIADQGCPVNGYSEMGILGTPVIDPSTNTMYLVAKTLESGNYVFRLHALNIQTGAETFGGPVVIQASYMLKGETVAFEPQHRMQRPALLLSNGVIYIGFGNMGCKAEPESTGWFMAYSASTLEQLAILDVAPDRASVPGIWMSGDGPSADSNGNVYLATGDGAFDYTLGGFDYGDTLMKVNLANGVFQFLDYFTPYNQAQLYADDEDLGSSGLLLLPTQAGPYPNLGVIAGKGGTIYLINQNNLGQYNTAADQVVEEVPVNPSLEFPEIYGGPSYWNQLIYFGMAGSPIEAFSLTNGVLSTSPVAQTATNYNLSSLFSISANGTQSGIVWGLEQKYKGSTGIASILVAFNASNLDFLYSGELSPSTHLAFPMVANGKVYVGTQTNLTVLGLLPEIVGTAGNKQTGQVGTALPTPLRVVVGNVYTKKAMAGVTVNFSDGGKGGSFSNPSPVTNSEGIADTTYTLPPNPSTCKLSVSRTGFLSAYFTETATAAQ